MTISTELAVKRYDGDGSTTSFPTEFKFLQNSHVRVILVDSAGVETSWAENTQYTLTGAGGESGGTVAVGTSPTDHTPQAGETLVITRVVPETQETDYPEGGAFPAAAHEQALDLLTMMVQKHSEEIVRALIFPIGDPASSIGPLPGAGGRAGRFLAFDAVAKPIAAAAPEGGNVVSGFMATVLDDVDAPAARGTLELATVSQAEAEAGTATTTRAWTAERVAQAIASLAAPAPEFTTGDVKLTLKATPDAGWVMMDDGTIGNTASGATTRADPDTEALYTLLWDNVADSYAAVSGGRGASAAADFAADKTIALPKVLGRALAVSGAGSGLTSRDLAATVGEEEHTQTEAEMAAHLHQVGQLQSNATTGAGGHFVMDYPGTSDNADSESVGSSDPFNVMQPTAFWNVMIKL